MSNSIDLCIVIPTFNRKKQLSVLLYQLKAQRLEDVNYKIIVVVDGSKDGTLELLSSEFPEVIVIYGAGAVFFVVGGVEVVSVSHIHSI